MDISTDEILSRYKQGKREDLIPILQDFQNSHGYISEEAIVKTGILLGLSTTKIYGLATFYDQFRFFPRGKIHLKVCSGTTCYVNGSQSIVNAISEELGIGPGEASRDRNFSYEVVTCMGGCNNAPVVMVNEDYQLGVSAEKIPDLIGKLKYIIDND